MNDIRERAFREFETRFPIVKDLDWSTVGKLLLRHCATVETRAGRGLDAWERELRSAGTVLKESGDVSAVSSDQLHALHRLMEELGFAAAQYQDGGRARD